MNSDKLDNKIFLDCNNKLSKIINDLQSFINNSKESSIIKTLNNIINQINNIIIENKENRIIILEFLQNQSIQKDKEFRELKINSINNQIIK